MNQADLGHFRTLLQQKKDQANAGLEELERISRSDETQEPSEDSSAYSLHMADRGTDAMEREKNMLFAQREGEYITYVDEALQRIEDGTFGKCRVCAGEVGRARLEAVPTATQCIDCKSKAEEAKAKSP